MASMVHPGWVAAAFGAFGFVAVAKLVGPEHCDDGWASSSIGSRGACSWHGGVDHSPEMLTLCAAVLFAGLGFIAAIRLIDWLEKPERERAALAAKVAEEARYAAALAAGELCPNCGSYMQRRTAQKGPNRGNYFMGCTAYPRCKTGRPLNERELVRWGRGRSERPSLQKA